MADSTRQFVTLEPGIRIRRLVDQSGGSGAITFGELEIDPQRALALHRHKVEEVIYVLEGSAEAHVDGRSMNFSRADAILAPAGVPHSLANVGEDVLRVAFMFPAVNVEREVVAD
jgi:quercetin dioxygenase-like cupin family protein